MFSSLVAIAVGAVLTFGVTAGPSTIIGLILIILGVAGLATRYRLSAIRRGAEPTSQEPGEPSRTGGRQARTPPGEQSVRTRSVRRRRRVRHGIMDIEPGSAQFRRIGRLND